MSDGSHGNALRDLQPEQSFFVGIDSDGCAFPSMELKHKECFIPEIVRYFALQPISKYVREAAEFVNLYSQWRGANRFQALLKVMDLLLERPEVQRATAEVPRLSRLREWAQSAPSLANPELMVAVRESNDPELRQVLDWSNAVNAAIARMVKGVPPFPGVEQILRSLQGQADVVVVSATPGDALQREWEEHRLDGYVRGIAGQEMGSKSEHLKQAAAGKYALRPHSDGGRRARRLARGADRGGPVLPHRAGFGRGVLAAVAGRGTGPVLRRHLRRRLRDGASGEVPAPAAGAAAMDRRAPPRAAG